MYGIECKMCSICLSEMESPLWLGCHVFCKECISLWVLNSASCPTCREKIPDELLLLFPRRSARKSRVTMMFTTDGNACSSVSSREMMHRVESLES